MHKRISKNGLNVLKLLECKNGEFDPVPYKDIAGHLTIGFGHKILPNEFYDYINEDEATEILSRDVSIAEFCLNRNIRVKLNQNQYDALVLLTYNIGTGAFIRSGVYRNIQRDDFSQALSYWARWNRAFNPRTGKKEITLGLVNRREIEMDLFQSLVGI